jgi:hypothetical protein
MAKTSDIEKQNLEAHVELCAERYRSLDQNLVAVEHKITGLELMIREVHDMVQNMSEKRNDQMINWGIGIGSSLLAMIGYLLVTYVFK